MRALVLLSALALPGCSLFGIGSVETAVVTGAQVERLDLDAPWDGPVPGDRPDVYLDLSLADRGVAGLLSSIWRSETAEDVRSLPLGFQAPPGKEVPLDRTVRLDVADADLVGDDLMFTTGPFSFADRYDGQEKGDTDRLAFDTDDGRVVVSVRWE